MEYVERELTIEDARTLARRAFAVSCEMHEQHFIGSGERGTTAHSRDYVWGVEYRYFPCSEGEPLDGGDAEALLDWVRIRMSACPGIPSAVADQVAADLGISQQQAASLCEVATTTCIRSPLHL